MAIDSQKSEYSLRVIAPAKINLHLQVLGLRPDGFHELSMVMQTIDLHDEILMKSTEDGQIKLDSNDASLSNGDDNLIVKAAKLINKIAGTSEKGALIRLNKKIPIGAGLAGGSSNAAATLVGLNRLWNLNLSVKEIEELSKDIGSDIPFCVSGGTQMCFGRGECLEALDLEKSKYAVLLVKDPLVNVSTPWAYSECKEINGHSYLSTEREFEQRRQILRDAEWLKSLSSDYPLPLFNDLQGVVMPKVLSVQTALQALSSIPYSLGCSMSGSGPSCFAVFKDIRLAQKALNENQDRFKSLGLQSWCCSFINHGVSIQP